MDTKTPRLPQNIKTKIHTRKHLQLQTPTTGNIARIQRLNTEIVSDIMKQQRECWKNILNNVTLIPAQKKL